MLRLVSLARSDHNDCMTNAFSGDDSFQRKTGYVKQ